MRRRITVAVFVLLLAALILGACQAVPPLASVSMPAVAPPAQQADESAKEQATMEVMDQFYEAYRTFDMDTMLSLQADDAVWTWIDPGKNLPLFNAEGKWAGTGKDEIRAMFAKDSGEFGFSGYPVWIEAHGNQVTATEIWEDPYGHEIDVPLIAQSTYKFRDGKIIEWNCTFSPESSSRYMNTPNTIAANKELMAYINEEIWNKGNLDLIDQFYASDYVRHDYAGDIVGMEAYKAYAQGLHAGFPDWHCEMGPIVAEGDMVTARYVCNATHTGEWMGLPPTGKHITFSSTDIHHIVNGKVVEDFVDYDSLGVMQQLGFQLSPPPAYQQPTVLARGGMLHSPNGIKAGPDGNLYIASSNEQAILVMNPETGEIIKRLGIEVGVDGPDDLAFGPDGSLYWTDFFRGSVGRLKPDGSISNQMVAPGVNPIAFSADGRLFTALGFLGDALYELDPNLIEPPRLLAENLGQLNSFQFGPDGLLYAPVMKKGQVIRIDVNVDPVEIEVVTEGLQCWLGWPVAAKFDSQGHLYVEAIAEGGAVDGIARVDIATGARETFAVVPYGMDNFTIDANDRFFAVLLADGSIGEVMPDGSFRLLGPVGFVMPGGIAALPRADGESIFLADTWSLREYDGVTGELRSRNERLAQPATVAPDGEALIMSSWFGNAVQVWNPQTQEVLETYYDFNIPLNAIRFQGDLIVAELGSSSVVRASGADPTQRTTLANSLGMPLGLAADNDDLWVSDRVIGKVWQLIAGGEVLAEPWLTASGLDSPEGMALTPNGHLLVIETGADRLVAIDPATGSVSTVAEGLGFNTRFPLGGVPSWIPNSVAVGQGGVVYVTADLANVIYRIEPTR